MQKIVINRENRNDIQATIGGTYNNTGAAEEEELVQQQLYSTT